MDQPTATHSGVYLLIASAAFKVIAFVTAKILSLLSYEHAAQLMDLLGKACACAAALMAVRHYHGQWEDRKEKKRLDNPKPTPNA